MNPTTDAQDAAEDPASREYIDVDDKAAVDRWAQALGTTDEALADPTAEVVYQAAFATDEFVAPVSAMHGQPRG